MYNVMKLVAGLGNPGALYAGTRHNIGFDVVDVLAQRLGFVSGADEFNRVARNRFGALMLDGTFSLPGRSEKLILLKPMAYMNLSGNAVQQVMAFYQIAVDDMIIVLDDLALPCGKIRMRAQGSDGGHNGLKDIERAIGSSRYSRLRVGIDPPPQFVPQKDYVLGKFSGAQKKSLKPAMDRAASAILCWIESGIVPAMTRFNAETSTDDVK